jgi:glycosyltransferase involved in cell wall biosynthesis
VRILHVVPSYIPAWRYGGPIRSVHGLCAALAARGHDVEVATTNVDGDRDSGVPLQVPVDIDGVTVRYFPCTRLRRLYYSAPMYRFMDESMRGWDLVHTHSVFLWPTTAAAHLARKFDKPYVLSPRGMLVRDLIARRSALRKRAWIALVESRNVARAAAIHVTSAVEADEILALGLKPRRMFEVPNGVDMPAGASEAPLREHGETLALPKEYVLFLGRISWKKGLDRLVSALTAAPGATLVVAGNDDEGYWPGLLQKAAALCVADRIRYIGFVEGERKREVLSRAAVLALPSYSENFGNVVLEAMALGVPVVVTPEVGLASVVEKSRSGLVVQGDPPLLGAAIARLLGNEALRRELGANARAAAKAFSWDRVAQRFEQEYLALLATRPDAPATIY